MTDFLIIYAITAAVGWPILWGVSWAHTTAKAKDGKVDGVSMDNKYTRQALVVMTCAIAFLAAFAWPVVLVAFIAFKIGLWHLQRGKQSDGE